MQLSAIIEALLVASEQPLPSSEIARIIRARVAEAEDALAAENEIEKDSNEDPESTPKDLPEELTALADINDDLVTAAIIELNRQYETSGRAFLCTERAKGWKIYTHPDYAAFVRQLFQTGSPAASVGPRWRHWRSSLTANLLPKLQSKLFEVFPVTACCRSYSTVSSSK